MTVCQAPALLGRPAGVRCARRRLGLRWRACRWAVSRLVLAGAWWPVAGQRPGLRLQQVTGGGQDGHLGRHAGRRLGGAGDGVAGCPDRGQVRDIESGWACLFIRGLLRGPSWGAARTHSPGSFEPTRNGDQGQAEPPDGLARAQKRIGYLRICEAGASSTAGSAPAGRAASKARPPRRRRQMWRSMRAAAAPGSGPAPASVGLSSAKGETGMRAREGTRLAAILIAGGAVLAVPATSALASATHGKVFF